VVARDVFREALAAAPLGSVQASHRLISDRDFERTENYEVVFRPSGNFYAMGTQVARSDGRAVHVGIHRPRYSGPFTADECRRLEFFSPHFEQAIRLMLLVDQYQVAARQSLAALDHLCFGVWLTNFDLHCRSANKAAEEIVRAGRYNLRMARGTLSVDDWQTAAKLRIALARLRSGTSVFESVALGVAGALLVLCANEPSAPLVGVGGEGLTVFLIDSARPLQLDPAQLRALWGLTPAEMRLLEAYLHCLNVNKASTELGLSVLTGRTQLKSVMQKMGVSGQPALVRSLLLGGAGAAVACR